MNHVVIVCRPGISARSDQIASLIGRLLASPLPCSSFSSLASTNPRRYLLTPPQGLHDFTLEVTSGLLPGFSG